MILTDIKQTKKGRYALFCDDIFQFSVDEEILVKYVLKEGMEVSPEMLSVLLSESDFNKAKEKAFRLLSYRNHSRSELIEKLERTFDENTACAVADKMTELGLLDDIRYAEDFVRELIHKGKSRMEIRIRLKQRGIPKDIIDLLTETIEVDEESTVRELVQKKYLSKLGKDGGEQSVYAALARKGFQPGTLRRVLDQINNGVLDDDS